MKKRLFIILVLVVCCLLYCFITILTDFSQKNSKYFNYDSNREIEISYLSEEEINYDNYFESKFVETNDKIDVTRIGHYTVNFYKSYFPFYKHELSVCVRNDKEPDIILLNDKDEIHVEYNDKYKNIKYVESYGNEITQREEISFNNYQNIKTEIARSLSYSQQMRYYSENGKIVEDDNNKGIRERIHYGLENRIYLSEEKINEKQSKIYVLAVGSQFEFREITYIVNYN